MITREMIQNGFNKGNISIEDEFGGVSAFAAELEIMRSTLQVWKMRI